MMNKFKSQGFTLVEMIIVIVITGIIGGMVAMFLRMPVQGYVDSARRAELTDVADTALRRISRDLRLALPNSVRVRNAAGGACSVIGNETCYLEFIPTTGGGRYRDSQSGGVGDILDFDIVDGSFQVLGTAPAQVAGDWIVVYNMTSAPADPNPNAYVGTNRAAYNSLTAGNIINIAPRQFPQSSCVESGGFVVGGCRFQVARAPVTYVCTPAPGGAGGTLVRWQEDVFAAEQPTVVPAGQPVLANNVSACTFNYDASVSAQRSGLVTMHLTISQADQNGALESVTLYAATHVNNVP